MAELGLLLLLFLPAGYLLSRYSKSTQRDVITPKQTENIRRLWEYAEVAISKQRYEMAERALLKILKSDQKNTAAYNRLGLIYVRMNRYDDAAACFDIASSLAPSIASLYNLGLVHFQSGNYEQAASALEKVVDLEPSTKRLLVFAKVHQKLGNHKRVVDIINQVVKEEPTRRNLEYLVEAYESAKQYKNADDIKLRIEQLQE